MNSFCKIFLYVIFLNIFSFYFSQSVDYGSDTQSSIVSPFGISGLDNYIKAFGWPKYGFSYVDSSVSCTYQSVYPVAGRVDLKGGILYLDSDLILTNTASLKSLGVIKGYGHVLELSESTTDIRFASGGDVFNLAARQTEATAVNSVSWSPDDSYIAAALDSLNPGNELFVYSYDSLALTKLIGADLQGNAFSVRWHPTATSPYYLATGGDKVNAHLRVYSYDSATNVLSQTTSRNIGASIYAVTWHPLGNYLAVGGLQDTQEIIVYPFTAGTLGTGIIANLTPNRDVSQDAMCWAPAGNGNYLAVGVTYEATSPELLLYYFDGATLTLTANVNVDQTVRSLDWSPTGSYIAVGLAGGDDRLRVYRHKIFNGTLTESTRLNETKSVYSVAWKPDGTKLAVGLIAGAGTDFRNYSFSSTLTPTLSLDIGIESSSNINSVRYSKSGTYIARGDASNFVSIYEPVLTAFTLENVNLFLNSNLTLRKSISLQGECSINGRGNKLIFQDSGSINVKPDTTVSIKLIDLDIDKPSDFALEGRTSKLIFEDSKINLNSDVVIGDGSLRIDGDVIITGPYIFNYATAYTSTIGSFSELRLEDGVTFRFGRNPVISQQPLIFTDKTSILTLDRSNLNITGSGAHFIRGKVNVSGNVNLDSTSSNTLYGLIFGDGESGNDPLLEISSGGLLNLRSGAMQMNTFSTTNLIFNGDSSQITLSSDFIFSIKNPLILSDGKISSNSSDCLNIESGAYLTADNMFLNDSNTAEEFYFTGTITSLDSLLLDKDNQINLVSGNLSKTVTVSRSGNKITGSGGFRGAIILVDENSTLTWDIANKMDSSNFELNEGVFVLDVDTGFVRSGEFSQTGTVNFQSNTFEFGPQDTTFTGSLYWNGTEAITKYNGKVSLFGTWTFNGSHIIKGQNNELAFKDSGQIFVDRNSTLEFRDALIENLRGSNIKCYDNSSKIIFNNVKISEHDDFRFDKGSIEFKNNVDLVTEDIIDNIYTFSYESTLSSTIAEYSNFNIYDGIRFCVKKQDSESSIEPIVFEEQSSTLNLDGGTLHVTSSGLQLIKGRLKASNRSTIEIDNNKFEYSLILGDGTAENDQLLIIDGGATLAIKYGRLFYNNSSPTNRIIFNNEAGAIRVDSDLGLSTWKDLTLANGILRFPFGDEIGAFNSSSFFQDNITHIHDIPFSVHRMKSELKPKEGSSYTNEYYLNDGGYFYSLEGNAGVPINFNSGTSRLGGAGRVSAQLVMNPNATLRTDLVTNLNTDIELNNETLFLDSDLRFVGDHKISGSGVVNLNGNKMIFGSDSIFFTDPIYWQATSGIDLNSRTTLGSAWTFNGNCNLNGNGNILELSPGGQLVVDCTSTLFLTDIALKGIRGTGDDKSLIFMNDDSKIFMSNVYLELDNNFSTTIGGIYVEGPTTVGFKNYDWLFDYGASLSVDGVTLWQDSLDYVSGGKIRFGSGEISKYLDLIESGTIKTVGNLDLTSAYTTNLAEQIRWNSNAIVSSDANVLAEYIIDNSNAIVTHDKEIENNSNAIIWHDEQIRWNSNAIVSSDATVLDELVRANSNAIVNFNINIAENFVSEDGSKMYLTRGITGGGYYNGRVFFSGLIDLQGETLEVDGDTIFSAKTTFISSGLLKPNGNAFVLGNDLTLPDGVDLKFTNSGIIDGQGHSLIFGHASKIRFDEFITVTLRNLKLQGVRNHSDGNASISILNPWRSQLVLENAELHLSDDFSFTSGQLYLHGDVIVCGTSQFNYTSTNAARITANSSFCFNTNTTFSYGPSTTDDRNLIIMENETSILYFNDAILKSTTTGLKLTKGTLIFDGRNYIYNSDDKNGEATSLSQAIAFGDASNDLNVKIMPAANVEVMSGFLDLVN